MTRTRLILASLLLVPWAALHAAESRPNILFLLGDDWAWPHASCLGTPGLQTPTFDRLAREGVLFRNAHVAAPSCSPSRAAMLTGQWHWRLEQAANLHAFIPPKFAVYPDLLAKAGYFVGLTGKGYGPGGDGGRPNNAAGPRFKSFEDFLSARPKDKPFCFWFGSKLPHRPYVRGSGEKNGLDPARVAVPPYMPDNDPVRGDICDYYLAAQRFDRDAGEALAALEKTGELDNTLIVMTGDNGWPFPRCKATCYVTGTHQPLAVRWGARVKGGRTVDDFVSLADLAPTFLEAAGLTPPAAMTARSFLNVLRSDKDGQVDPARDHVLTGMERHVTRGREDGAQRGVGYPMRTIVTRDFHYIRNFRPNRWPAADPPAGALPGFEEFARNTYAGYPDVDAGPSKAWLLTHRDDPAFQRAFGKRPGRELYDLRNDPFELTNLAADPAYADRVKDLDARLMAELKATDDPRATGAGDEFDRYSAAPSPAKNAAAGQPKPAQRMNIVFILADDLGWSDTTLYGTTTFYETPNLERLAKRGMTFANAYAANPLCSPTRASIMTGLYPARVGITTPCCHEPEVRIEARRAAKAQPFQPALQAISVSRLKPEYYTLAEALRDAGYATGHFGKWHLGAEPYSPLQQGFEVDVPHYPGPGPAGSYVAPWRFPPALQFTGRPGEHIEDRMTDEAIRFLTANKDKPFFLNYWAFSVHAPFDAKTNLTAKYRAKAVASDPQRCPVYGAMVQSLDDNVGRLLEALDALNLADRTIVVFFSDNGGNMYDRVEGIPPTSNAPLRGGKATLYEGGTREPCVVVWPGKVKPGSRSDALLSSVDWYPTLLDMAGVQPKQAVTCDGVSQTPALLGVGAPRDTVFCHFPHYTPATGALPATWVRRGDWKLIRFFCDNPDQTDRFELYNLKDDLGETRNRAADEPGLVKELAARIDAFLTETGAVIPAKNPTFDPKAERPPGGKTQKRGKT